MPRVLHFSDLHLGVENYGRLDVNTGLSTRLMDFLRALDTVVEYALAEQVDLVLFTGDAFKNRDPTPTHQREFARRLRRLREADIPVFLLVGNHDMPNAANRAHSMEIYATLGLNGLYVAHKPAAVNVPTRSGPLSIFAVPWVTRSRLLAREEARGRSNQELVQELQEAVVRVIQEFAHRARQSQAPTVLAAHLTVEGAAPGAERHVLLGHDIVVPKEVVADPAFDYVALGHIHRHQCLHEQPPVVYAGSVERIDFGEAQEPKGFVVADVRRGGHYVDVCGSQDAPPGGR
ncbi:MAG: exonuclease SbcCD subunit D [Ardenticatenia bacterium]|nr:exonuclease SbcCD subunit D [Ardenticatenia bacterium]